MFVVTCLDRVCAEDQVTDRHQKKWKNRTNESIREEIRHADARSTIRGTLSFLRAATSRRQASWQLGMSRGDARRTSCRRLANVQILRCRESPLSPSSSLFLSFWRVENHSDVSQDFENFDSTRCRNPLKCHPTSLNNQLRYNFTCRYETLSRFQKIKLTFRNNKHGAHFMENDDRSIYTTMIFDSRRMILYRIYRTLLKFNPPQINQVVFALNFFEANFYASWKTF